ncbi:putative membrane-spanning ATPase [Microthyrium microscopicum]|uniref:Putative membrane-spanning ATPase n=1 Tax=Microthyrium microscopicum TaxID=703497 RepID=A0A6A6TUU3_9PEZI|nr:putative membrane-spanning ATPase [Microthyrium microscopicum]
MPSGSRKWEFLQDVFLWTAPTIVSFFLIRQLLSHLSDPEGKQQSDKALAATARKRIQSIIGSRREAEDTDTEDEEYPYGQSRPKAEDIQLTTYEQTIATELVAAKDIPVTFEDIGGLEDIIEELKESVIYPLTIESMYAGASSLLSAPSGVLLYGPPGCGKTMLAKALAHESGACFINLHISTLTEKWYGDSNKLVRAVFSLARKLEPTIVFIDEIDAVLGTRRSGEHEASAMVKAEFMTHWDGLVSSSSTGRPQRICILGATNRIQDIDEAILRRMPKKFPVPLPNAAQRRGIFKLVLKDTKVDRDNFDVDYLVKVSAGLSGSDIKEACRDAAMLPMREFIKKLPKNGAIRKGINHRDLRGIRTDDFFKRAQEASRAAARTEVIAAQVEELGEDRAWTDASSEAGEEAERKHSTVHVD